MQSSVVPLVDRSTLNALQQTLIHIATRKLIDGAIRTTNIDIRQLDVSTNTRTATNHISRNRTVLGAGSAMDILHDNIRDGQFGGELIASSQILLAVALCDFDGVVDVVDVHGVVGDVVDTAFAASALEVSRKCGGGAGPHFDAGAVAGVGHGDVVDEDVLYYVGLGGILAERSNTDAMTSVALQVLN